MEDKILTPEEAGEAAIQYVKDNVNEIIKKWAGDDGFGKEAKPVSVFMAGSPGAGKTEISKNLLDVLESSAIDSIKQKVVRIDTDEIRLSLPTYIKGQAQHFQGAASLAVSKIHDYVLDHGKNFILDSTFSSYERSHENIRRSLKRSRAVFVFYIYLDPIKAWDYTQKREKIEGRNIRKEDFIRHFFDAREAVNRAKDDFGKNIVLNLIERDTENDDIRLKINIDNIDSHIKMSYNKKYLEDNLKYIV